MALDRVVLALNAAFAFVSGVACVVAPETLAQQIGMSVIPTVSTEIRAFYGGQLIGVGLFLMWCMRRADLTVVGLVLIAISVGGVGLARTLGMLVLDRDPTGYHVMNLAIEVTTVTVVAAALTWNRRLAHA